MRTLSNTLLAAQQSSSHRPYVRITASNAPGQVVNLQWERLYAGSEADGSHALIIPADGSLIRVRVTPLSDNLKLYRQRVINPGPGSDFSQWTYLGQYAVVAATLCSCGSEVSLFWCRSDGEVTHLKSSDYGATWPFSEYPFYSSGQTPQIAATYKPNGDLTVFLVDAATLCVHKRVNGVWQGKIKWDKVTGMLSGVAALYDGDYKLLVSGQDNSGNYKVWTVVYGDGGELAAGTWSALKEITTAAAGGQFSYGGLFLDKPDTFRCSFSERFTGLEAYQRPFRTQTLPETAFLESRWSEPVPWEVPGGNGLALAHANGYAWMTSPSGVWRAALGETTHDLSSDVSVVKQLLTPDSGELEIELRNDNGQYAPLPDWLQPGCRIDLAPGYQTSAGSESSAGLSFTLQDYEYIRAPGKAALILYASDGWNDLRHWTARYQLRWNQPDAYGEPTQQASVKEILAQLLAKVGIKLEVKSQSAVITGFYPDFTVHAGDDGQGAIKRLLTFVPDVIFLEGAKAYLVNPLATDPAVYAYGSDHAILEGRYRSGAWNINRVQVDGWTHVPNYPPDEEPLYTESQNWEEIKRMGDRVTAIEDRNLSTVDQARSRGESWLREAEIASRSGYIRIPVNCGQQLYDPVEINDPLAGMNAAKRRILGIKLAYETRSGGYGQKMILGGM